MTCKEEVALLKSKLEKSATLADFRKSLTIDDELPIQVKDKEDFLSDHGIRLRDSKQFPDGVATISQIAKAGIYPQDKDHEQHPVVILLSPGGIEELYEISYH